MMGSKNYLRAKRMLSESDGMIGNLASLLVQLARRQNSEERSASLLFRLVRSSREQSETRRRKSASVRKKWRILEKLPARNPELLHESITCPVSKALQSGANTCCETLHKHWSRVVTLHLLQVYVLIRGKEGQVAIGAHEQAEHAPNSQERGLAESIGLECKKSHQLPEHLSSTGRRGPSMEEY